jgi:predicted CoA-substrate-specific enzyme activase
MTKICLLNITENKIVDLLKQDSTENHTQMFDQMIDTILSKNNVSSRDIYQTICTGYGRKNYSRSDVVLTEILCHSRGVNYFDKSIKTIIDMGGQDTKIIKVSPTGKVMDFLMNDKCAAGTGRFIEKIADFFSVYIEQLSDICSRSTSDIDISSTCIVFAESEMIGLIARGESRENIVKAVFRSIAHRIVAMSGQLQLEPPIAFVGGVANISSMISSLSECLQSDIIVPAHPDFTGAIGAAVSYQ